MNPKLVIAVLRSRRARAVVGASVLVVVLFPVLVATAVTGLVAQEQAEGCAATGPEEVPMSGGASGGAQDAAPLALKPGQRYEVGATEYGGPRDPTSGAYGSIPDPGQSYLPSHPDSFAELSVLASNPANGGTFTFADANALNRLPYLSALRVSHAGRSMLLFKRDTGYGQGPGQHIGDGQPYRLDVWWQAAQTLGVSKTPVQIELTPATGAAATLEALPEAAAGTDQAAVGSACPTPEDAGQVPLALMPGTRTRILASGLAAAGEEAPAAVKRMVAAGNRLDGASYLYGGAHGSSLDTLQPAYDCSSAVSFLLHAGGALGIGALDSSALESYGRPGPGRWVSIYANAAHTFIYVGGLRFDTVEDPAYDSGANSGAPGPRWRVSDSVPAWASWVVRHPPGL